MSAFDTIKSAVLGNPVDPNKQPSRVGVVKAFAEMQSQLEGAQAGALVFDTFAALPTGAVPSANIMAWVMNGSQAGIYQNTGSALVSAWTRRGDIPQFSITGVNTGDGTANAIQVTTDRPVPTQDGRALIIVPVLAANTISPPSVSINGGAALPIVTNAGNNVVIGGITAGMYLAGFVSDGKFRLLSDQASAAIVAAAEDAANRAEIAALSVNVRNLANRAAVKAFDTTSNFLIFFDNSPFKWQTGDFSAQIAADTVEGIYIKSNAFAATVGAWVRQFDCDWNPAWFGILPGNSGSVNRVAMNAMLSLAALKNTAIRFPNGTYNFDQKIVKSSAFVLHLKAESERGVKFRWTIADGGINLEYTNILLPHVWEGIVVITTAASGGKGLHIKGPAAPYNFFIGPRVSGFGAYGEDTTADYWTECLVFEDAWHPYADRPNCKGQDNTVTNGDIGIHFLKCMVMRHEGHDIKHVGVGIAIDGGTLSEGCLLGRGEIVGARTGVRYNPDIFKPGVKCDLGHINAYETGIRLQNIGQMEICGTHIYKTNLSSMDFKAIDAQNCFTLRIHDIFLSTPQVVAGVNMGIVLNGCTHCIIHHITGEEWTGAGALVYLDGSTTEKNRINHIYPGRLATGLVPVGINAVVAGNNFFESIGGAGRKAFVNGDTTPSVINDLSGEWQFNNSSATIVTRFDNGYEGQKISVLFSTGNTTLTHNANQILKGGANVAPAAGSIMKFRYDEIGDLWREETRNF